MTDDEYFLRTDLLVFLSAVLVVSVPAFVIDVATIVRIDSRPYHGLDFSALGPVMLLLPIGGGMLASFIAAFSVLSHRRPGAWSVSELLAGWLVVVVGSMMVLSGLLILALEARGALSALPHFGSPPFAFAHFDWYLAASLAMAAVPTALGLTGIRSVLRAGLLASAPG